MKQLKRLLLMLLLITVGAQSAWADDITYANVNGVTYALYPDFYSGDYAYMVNIVGTNEVKTIVVPERINSNGKTYFVAGVREPNYSGSSNITTSTMADWSGKVETLIFEGSIQIPATGYTQPALSCQSLKDIYFLQSTPAFDQGTYNDYFNINMMPKNTITLHVVDKTAAQIATLKTQEVFKDFKDIVACDGLNPIQPVNAITYKDDAVKAICVTNWDTDGDGELSYEEAAAVQYLTNNNMINGTRVFNNINNVTFFDELQYFTGLKGLSNAFLNCTSLQSVIVPACITSLASNTFKGCTSLKSVVIKGAVSRMQDSFYGCTALETVTFEGNTTEIGENSFYNCRSLKTITLPESLTKINYNAFQNCTSLRCIYIPKNVSNIDGRFLWGCNALEAIVVDSENATYQSPNGCNAILTADGKTFVAGCKYSTIPEGVETIGEYSLRGMAIKSIVIPASVTSIGEYAFSGCSSLESVVCLSETAPTLGSNSMSHGNKANCILTVPYGCSSAYSAWTNYFKEIVETPTPESHWTIHVLDGMEGVKMTVSLGNVLIGENDITGVYGNHFMSKNTPRTYQLKVPVDNEGRPVRVVCNGDDLTYQFDNYADGYLYYDMHVYQDEDWIISYETSHRQTFIRKGGTENGVEVEYDFPVDGYERYYNPDNVGTPLYVDFPTYHAQEARCAYITIDVEDGKTLKVLRNGVIINVDKIFKPTSGAATGFTRRMLKESDYADGNGSTLESLGFELRDPATWEITIENASKMLNAYANNDVIVTLVKLVDGQEQNEGGLENTIHAWVNEGETYIVKFFPQHNEELTRFDIGWSPITIENESRLVKNADGSYSFTITYDQMDSKYFDILAVFETSGSARNIFVKTNSLEYTDVFIGGNRYGSLNRGSNSKMYEVPEGATFQLEPFVQQDMVKKVMLNGVDITNNETYLRQKEESMGTGKYWLYDFTSIEGDAFIDIIYVKPQFDTNEDGNVNVTDVTTLVNKILHQ